MKDLNPRKYPPGDLTQWSMLIDSHKEYIAVSHAFADQITGDANVVVCAAQRIHDLAAYCNRLKRECDRVTKRLGNVRTALEEYIDPSGD